MKCILVIFSDSGREGLLNLKVWLKLWEKYMSVKKMASPTITKRICYRTLINLTSFQYLERNVLATQRKLEKRAESIKRRRPSTPRTSEERRKTAPELDYEKMWPPGLNSAPTTVNNKGHEILELCLLLNKKSETAFEALNNPWKNAGYDKRPHECQTPNGKSPWKKI